MEQPDVTSSQAPVTCFKAYKIKLTYQSQHTQHGVYIQEN
jgi:hypothetical protein